MSKALNDTGIETFEDVPPPKRKRIPLLCAHRIDGATLCQKLATGHDAQGVYACAEHGGHHNRQTTSVDALAADLNQAFPERRDVIKAVLVAAVAGEHVTILGPPGTAKSLLARRLAGAFSCSYFEHLMTRFTTPDEVFGPVKLSGLQQDRFTRATAGYLPSAQVVFLDEVFKANSAILNALLTALNERVFHDDGKPQPIPLVSCIAASNELPEGPELDALYDRFLVRVVADYISDEGAFRAMLSGSATVAAKVDIAAEQAAARKVTVSPVTIDALVALRAECKAQAVVVSDRRWRQALSLVRAVAHIDGRTVTEAEDLEILEHVLWKKPDERSNIARLVQRKINPDAAKAVAELDAARDIVRKLPNATTTDPGQYMGHLGSASKDAQEIVARLERLPQSRRVVEALAEAKEIKNQIAKLALKAAGIEV